MLIENGCWAHLSQRGGRTGHPCLFLDRDGVLVEETKYLHRPADVRLISGAASLIRKARMTGWICGLVTNQAGIGRGYYGWDDFRAVQEEIVRRLYADGASLDFVMACPYHPAAAVPEYCRNHLWRKPHPGMLTTVIDHYASPLHDSMMVGDSLTDMVAGARAGVGYLIHVATGHGAKERADVVAWAAVNRQVHMLASVAELAGSVLAHQSVGVESVDTCLRDMQSVPTGSRRKGRR